MPNAPARAALLVAAHPATAAPYAHAALVVAAHPSSEVKLLNLRPMLSCVPAVLRHPLGLRSAYPLPEDARSQWWTTWKKRGEHEVRHAADHTLP